MNVSTNGARFHDRRQAKKDDSTGVCTSGKDPVKLCILAFFAASMTSSMDGVLELSPYAMFS